jgi:hypothetical protein
MNKWNYPMKTIIAFILLALSAALLTAGNATKPAKDPPAFKKIKSLAGAWNGKAEGGKSVVVNYEIVSGGSVVMETMNYLDNRTVVVTMYYMNGKNLMLTHYGASGIQPRMKASSSGDANRIAFSLMDVTNLSNPKDIYMKKLVLTFKDSSHFSQEWNLSIGGTQGSPQKIVYERAR